VKSQLACLPALALAATSIFAQAQAPSGNKVAVINMQAALVSTKDGQKASAELESKANPKRKELQGKQDEINSLKDQLQKGANTLSETSKQNLYRDIDDKTKRLNRDVQDAEEEFNQQSQKALQGLFQRMMVVIDKYARDNGFTLVLDVSSQPNPVLYASNTIDITKEIVELYDKNAPSGTTSTGPATLPAPKSATPAPSAPAARPATPPAAAPAQPKPPAK